MADAWKPDSWVEMVAGDKRCRDICRGERSATDSPARYGRDHEGKKVLYCTCCRGLLRLASMKDYGPDVTAARFGQGATAQVVRLYTCSRCQYDVQSIAAIT